MGKKIPIFSFWRDLRDTSPTLPSQWNPELGFSQQKGQKSLPASRRLLVHWDKIPEGREETHSINPNTTPLFFLIPAAAGATALPEFNVWNSLLCFGNLLAADFAAR